MVSERKEQKERNRKRMYSLEIMSKSRNAIQAFHRKPYAGCGLKNENSSILKKNRKGDHE